jgi:hypothetical protein
MPRNYCITVHQTKKMASDFVESVREIAAGGAPEQSKISMTRDGRPRHRQGFGPTAVEGELLDRSEFGLGARDPSTATCRSLSERQASAQDDSFEIRD